MLLAAATGHSIAKAQVNEQEGSYEQNEKTYLKQCCWTGSTLILDAAYACG
jgi:hypothetical protein